MTFNPSQTQPVTHSDRACHVQIRLKTYTLARLALLSMCIATASWACKEDTGKQAPPSWGEQQQVRKELVRQAASTYFGAALQPGNALQVNFVSGYGDDPEAAIVKEPTTGVCLLLYRDEADPAWKPHAIFKGATPAPEDLPPLRGWKEKTAGYLTTLSNIDLFMSKNCR